MLRTYRTAVPPPAAKTRTPTVLWKSARQFRDQCESGTCCIRDRRKYDQLLSFDDTLILPKPPRHNAFHFSKEVRARPLKPSLTGQVAALNVGQTDVGALLCATVRAQLMRQESSSFGTSMWTFQTITPPSFMLFEQEFQNLLKK